jgi:hypothetical protein
MMVRDKSPRLRVVECEYFANHIGLKAVSLGKPLYPLITVRQQVPGTHTGIADHGLSSHPSGHRLDRRTL